MMTKQENGDSKLSKLIRELLDGTISTERLSELIKKGEYNLNNQPLAATPKSEVVHPPKDADKE